MFNVANFLHQQNNIKREVLTLVKVIIGNTEVNLSDVNESWINLQINRRRRDGIEVCVQAKIHEGDLNLILSTPTCQKTPGSFRAPNNHERRLFELWNKMGLNSHGFTGGNLIAFLKQLQL